MEKNTTDSLILDTDDTSGKSAFEFENNFSSLKSPVDNSEQDKFG